MPQGFERTAALKREGGGKRTVLRQSDDWRLFRPVDEDLGDSTVREAADGCCPSAPVVLEIDQLGGPSIREAFGMCAALPLPTGDEHGVVERNWRWIKPKDLADRKACGTENLRRLPEIADLRGSPLVSQRAALTLFGDVTAQATSSLNNRCNRLRVAVHLPPTFRAGK
jgi:hypothetical protein